MTGGTLTLSDTEDHDLFNSSTDANAAHVFYVKNLATSADIFNVAADGIQKAGEYIPLAPGDAITLRKGNNALTRVFGHAGSGGCTIYCGLIAKL